MPRPACPHAFTRRKSARGGFIIFLAATLAGWALAATAEDESIQIDLSEAFASFTNPDHPDNRIGYRFFEHTPIVHGQAPARRTEEPRPEWASQIARFRGSPGVKVFHRSINETGWISQDWTFYLAPGTTGVEMLWVVQTAETGLPEFFGVQQCFRLTGARNAVWRQKYARAPAFSEFDAWNGTTPGEGQGSLTWVLRDGALQQLPARKETVGCRTTYGARIDEARSGGHVELLEFIGPYHARMLWTTESGLILRASADRKWSAGIYWERTTHVSDHHPADCLHAIVNIGNVPPHSLEVLRGKIYWFPGPGEALVAQWRKDFPDQGLAK